MKKISNILTEWKILVILSLVTIFSIGNMTSWSIWFDEAFTAYIVRFNFWEIYNFTAVDVHPPLYYWVVKMWTFVFGTSEFGFRSLSLVFALIALIGLYKILRIYFTRNTASFAVLLAGLLPILIRFTEEARSYTMVLAIVTWATYLLVLQQGKNPKKWRWFAYGLLLAAGMWTHYYAALAWAAHWVWRFIETKRESKKNLAKRFFSREWVTAHIIALVVFLPWIPIVAKQLTTVQAGFWIPDFGAYTLVDYLSNGFIYQQYGKLLGWEALLFLCMCALSVLAIVKAYKLSSQNTRSGYLLLLVMSLVPPALLVLASMPPLTSSFIDRYVLYSVVFLTALVGVSIVSIHKHTKSLSLVTAGLMLVTLGVGIYNVYYYGNYNKNSATSVRVKEVVHMIRDQGESGQAIVSASPWIYYEAAFYDSYDHHVYFLDEKTEYTWGSLEMLKVKDIGKIKNLEEFTSRHRYVWYLDNVSGKEVIPPVEDWKRIKSVGAYDEIDKSIKYRASLFDTHANEE